MKSSRTIIAVVATFFTIAFAVGAITISDQVFKGDVDFQGALKLDRTEVTSTASELNRVDDNFAFGIASYGFGTSDAQDAVDVSSVNGIFLDASSYNITIRGFANGVSGQVIYLTAKDSSNTININDDDGNATQKIHLDGDSNQTLAVNEGMTLMCNGTAWYEVGR